MKKRVRMNWKLSVMPKNVKKASEKAPDEHQNDSVYDFLYQDARRIGSFLAQFDDSGHLQQVRQSESYKKGNKRGIKIFAGAGVSSLGSGNVGFETMPHEAGSELSERIYDPLWSNARALLDYLSGAGLINRDITAAHISQFVIVSGELTVLNAAIMAETWVSPNMREMAVKQYVNNAKAVWNANPVNAAMESSDKDKAESLFLDTAKSHALIALENIKYYPHSVNCTIRGDRFSVWSPLHEEGMTGSANDLSLMHGSEVPGVWNLLGILDALPSPIPPQILVPPSPIPVNFAATITLT